MSTDWWREMTDADVAHARRPITRWRCAYCRGITSHHSACVELRHDWARMRFGKFKGRHIGDVPEGYLRFLMRGRFGSSEDRRQWLDELQQRDPIHKSPVWEDLVNEEVQHVTED